MEKKRYLICSFCIGFYKKMSCYFYKIYCNINFKNICCKLEVYNVIVFYLILF